MSITGTTWTSEILHQIYFRQHIKVDNKFPLIERTVTGNTMDILENMPAPRIMATHLPYPFYENQITDGKVKFIVVMRNPKDTLVSLFHFGRANRYFNVRGAWSDFFEVYLEDGLDYGDMIDHNIMWWNQRHRDNILVITFEDMLKDLRGAIWQIAKFCGKDLDDDTLDHITSVTTFDSMKKNPATNKEDLPHIDNNISPFMRKGQVGDWKNYFTEDQDKIMDERICQKTEGTGMKYVYKIK